LERALTGPCLVIDFDLTFSHSVAIFREYFPHTKLHIIILYYYRYCYNLKKLTFKFSWDCCIILWLMITYYIINFCTDTNYFDSSFKWSKKCKQSHEINAFKRPIVYVSSNNGPCVQTESCIRILCAFVPRIYVWFSRVMAI